MDGPAGRSVGDCEEKHLLPKSPPPGSSPDPARHGPSPAASAALLVVLVSLAAAPTVHRHTERKYHNDPLVRALEGAAPEGTVVGVVGGNRWYALYGSRLQNRVVVIPRGAPLDERFYRWGDRHLPPMEHLSGTSERYPAWHRKVLRSGAELLVIHGESGGQREQAWARAHPHHFQPVTFFGEQHLWRVLR